MSIYTKSSQDYGANFHHKFNLNCHEMFDISEMEPQLMAYQFNLL